MTRQGWRVFLLYKDEAGYVVQLYIYVLPITLKKSTFLKNFFRKSKLYALRINN